MPTDNRLRKIVEVIVGAPAERGTVQAWALRAGMSEHTLAYPLMHQTGMSFGAGASSFT